MVNIERKLLSQIAINDNGCWIWCGRFTRDGYGKLTIAERTRAVHRVAYETWCGEIPVGFEIDHLCFVKACVNPAHLEAVTPEENRRRALVAGRFNLAPQQHASHCVHGHPVDEVNTYRHPDGHRQCRQCRNAWDRNTHRAVSCQSCGSALEYAGMGRRPLYCSRKCRRRAERNRQRGR
jgi:hypothetical protein